MEAGCKKYMAKNFHNCINPALLQGPPDRQVIEFLTFPELHVMTGTVGHLVNNMIKTFPEGEELITNYMKDHTISWCAYHPGTFEGKQARKFLKFSEILLVPAMKLLFSSEYKAIEIITIMQFNKVVVACFGQELRQNFRETITKFVVMYRKLPICVTPKVHLVFVHLIEFLETKGFVDGLGAWSEQAMESVHHDMKMEWDRAKVKPSHPEFESIFLKFVVKYNSKHV